MRISDWSSDVCSSDLLQSSVLKKHFKGFNSFSAKLHLLLLWRTVLKSVRDSFIFFSPKVFLQRSYSYLKRSEERRVGKSVSVRVDLGGRRIIKKKNKIKNISLTKFNTIKNTIL